MTAKQSLTIVLRERPEGDIVPSQTFREEYVNAPTEADLKDGEVLYETYYLSLDPTNRVALKGQ